MRKPVSYENMSLEETLAVRLFNLRYLEFSLVVKRVLEGLGYEEVRPSRRLHLRGLGSQGGFDMEAFVQSPLGRVPILVQIKRSFDTVQRRYVDELRAVGIRKGVPLGLIVTLGDFSQTAIDAASAFPGRPVELLSGEQLVEGMISARVGVVEEVDIVTGEVRPRFSEDAFILVMNHADRIRDTGKRRKIPGKERR